MADAKAAQTGPLSFCGKKTKPMEMYFEVGFENLSHLPLPLKNTLATAYGAVGTKNSA